MDNLLMHYFGDNEIHDNAILTKGAEVFCEFKISKTLLRY